MSSLEQFVLRLHSLITPKYTSPLRELDLVLTPLVREIEALRSLCLVTDAVIHNEEFRSSFLYKIRSNTWILQYQSKKLWKLSRISYLWYICVSWATIIVFSLILAPFHLSLGLSPIVGSLLSFAEAVFIAPHIECIVTILFFGPLCDSLKKSAKTLLYSGPAWLIAEEQWKLSPHLRIMAQKLALTHNRL